MQFTLTVDMDNDAFDRDGAELRRILLKVAKRLEDFDGRADRGAVMDVNGNTVGTWRIG